jgi:hypothetical protein
LRHASVSAALASRICPSNVAKLGAVLFIAASHRRELVIQKLH